MKQTLQATQTLKQNLTFNAALYDSLDILKLSGYELIESIFEAVQENPLLEIDDTISSSFESYDVFRTITKPISLKEHLFSQLHTCSYNYNEAICQYIIEALDTHGFFTEDFKVCASDLQITYDELIRQLTIIQSFEPCGVAASSSIDSLIIQAKAYNHTKAIYILTYCIDEVLNRNYRTIANKLHCSEKEVLQSLDFIQSLSPYPCSSFQCESDTYILPDLTLEFIDGSLILSPKQHVALRYQDDYISLMSTNPVLKDYFEQAKVFITNINKRNATMMLVVNEIINQQSGYYLYQDELRSLKQRDIAQILGINQATVSRAIMGKYYEFENNTYPISHLFVTSTMQGDSSDSIKKAIKDIIIQEDKCHPYSDLQIVKKLIEFDYRVSRRTVTKYRESFGIPSTRERRKH